MEDIGSLRRTDMGRPGGGGVALSVNDQLEYMEFCLGMDKEAAKRIK